MMINYAKHLTAAHVAFRREIREMVQNLPFEPADRVLDVPSGDGFYSALFAERLNQSGQVVAVDLDEEMLNAVEHRDQHRLGSGSIEGVYGNAYRLPFDDESFDFVWCAQSLISLSRFDEKPPGEGTLRALREIRRVLRADGWIGLLEQDALHHVLLPWPTELELEIHRAHRQGFATIKGHPRQLDAGRRQGKILGETGFHSVRRITLAADRYGQMDGEVQLFLKGYFGELRHRIEQHLTPDNLRHFDLATNPKSDISFFNDSHFEMTWLSFVTLGRKHPGAL